MKNQLVAQILFNIADILELQQVKFKPQAYRRVAATIENSTEDIEEIYKRGELYDMPGVGEHIGLKIEEILKTGKLKYYTKLKKECKIDIENLKAIPNLGIKKIKVLYDKLKIRNVKDLENAIAKRKIRDLPGFGEKSEQTFLDGIELRKVHTGRFLYKDVEPIARKIKAYFFKFPSVKKVDIAGSFRRKKGTIGDLDVLIVSNDVQKIMDAFTSMKDVTKIINKGMKKSAVRLKNGLQVDLRVVKGKEWGAAFLYFTGNKQHNVLLRKIALKKGMTLNEYRLATKEGEWVAGKTEHSIYRALGLTYVKPEKRFGKKEA